jgi:hypothetical protein
VVDSGLRRYYRLTEHGGDLLADEIERMRRNVELNPWTTAWFGFEQHGQSVSLGVGVWAAWLLAAVVHVMAPGRWTRLAIGLALPLTVAVVPLAAVVYQYRPPLFVLLAQTCLGLVALGVPARLPRWLRLLPLAGAAAALPVAAILAHKGGNRRGGCGGDHRGGCADGPTPGPTGDAARAARCTSRPRP